MNKEKLTFGVNEDTKGTNLYRFIIKNMKFNEVMDLYKALKFTIKYSISLENKCCCDVSEVEINEK